MFNKRNETRFNTTKVYSINKSPKIKDDSYNSILNYNLSFDNDPLPKYNTYRSASKTSTIKESESKKYGMIGRRGYGTSSIPIDTNKYSRSKVIVKKEPIITNYTTKYKYDSKTSSVNSSNFNIDNYTKNNAFLSGPSQTSYISTNNDLNKYRRNYYVSNTNKKDDSNSLINSNRRLLINTTSHLSKPVTTKITSIPTSKYRNNTSSRTNHFLSKNYQYNNLNDRSSDTNRYSLNSYQRSSITTNSLLGENPLQKNYRNHTYVVSKSVSKNLNSGADININRRFESSKNLPNIGIHSIDVSKRKERKNYSVVPRKTDVIFSSNTNINSNRRKYSFSSTDKGKDDNNDTPIRNINILTYKNNFLEEIKNKKKEDEIKTGYNTDDQKPKINIFTFESKYTKLSHDRKRKDDSENKPKNLKRAIELTTNKNYEYEPKDIKISNETNNSKYIEYKPLNILNETKTYKSELNEEKTNKLYEYKPLNILNETKNNKLSEFDPKNIMASIESKIKSINIKNYGVEPKTISLLNEAKNKNSLDVNPRLLNRSEINNIHVYESKNVSKPKGETINNNYTYNITNISRIKPTTITTTTNEIKTINEYKPESLIKTNDTNSILNKDNESKTKYNFDFKSKYLNRFSELKNNKTNDNEPKSTKASIGSNIKNIFDFKPSYLSKKDEEEPINIKINNVKEPTSIKTTNVHTIYESKAKNINQSKELNKIKNYVMMPRNINILNEKKIKIFMNINQLL